MNGSFSQFIGPLAHVFGLIEGAGDSELAALVAQLEQAGLGDQVHSWLDHGATDPVTIEELARAFTPGQLQLWAAQAGTSPESLLAHLTKELPGALRQVSANTRTPPGLSAV